MKTLLLAGTLLAFGTGLAAAQATGTTNGGTAAGAPAATAPAHPTTGGNSLGAATPNRDATAQDRAAAGGNGNQAVATTHANASEPAKGANSFTEGQARQRIADNGFSDVGALQKDNDGVWRGQAMKNGQRVQVWLDYKGNVGTGQM